MTQQLDDEIINSILEHNLNRFINLNLTSFDINRFLKPFDTIKLKGTHIIENQIHPTYSSLDSYLNRKQIKGPTALILSIISESTLILKYILENLNPDLSITVNGWTPFHFACSTQNTNCLQLLLNYEYIKQNIDYPIISPTFSNSSFRQTTLSKSSFKQQTTLSKSSLKQQTTLSNSSFKQQTTTGLHIAVSNRLYKTAIILLFEEKRNKSCYNEFCCETSNVNLKATSGNTSLHIAIHNHDYEMIQILIYAGCDPTIKNNDGLSCIEYAQRLGLDQKYIHSMIEGINLEPFEQIVSRHFEQPEMTLFIENEEHSQNQEQTQKVENEIKMSIDELRLEIQRLTEQLKKRESNENENLPSNEVQPSEVRIDTEKIETCDNCGAPAISKCPQCRKNYCEICKYKSCHECNN